MNHNISKSFYQSPSRLNDHGPIDKLYETLKKDLDDRALHKRYLEERDFAKKDTYL
jgi:hypothetical protein